MQKRINELVEQIESVSQESIDLRERLEQLDAMYAELAGELSGYKNLEKDLAEQKKRASDAKKEKEGEETCGKDLSDSMTQTDDE